MKKIPMFLLMLNTFTVLVGVGIIIPVLPAYLEYFHASGTTAGLLVAAFGATQFVFSPFGGRWSDRYGRKPLILTGMVLNALSHVLFAVAEHLSVLYLSRLIGGIGLGLTIPSVMAYVADVTDREQRGKGMGWIGASVSLGMAIGPGIGGFLADFSVRAPYYAAALLTMIAMVVSFVLLPETRTSGNEVQISSDAVPKASVHQQFYQYQSAHSRIFMLLVLNFIMTFGLMSFETVFPLFADDRYGFTTKEIAGIITAGAILGAITQTFLLSRIVVRYGEIRLIHATLFLAACTLSLMLVWGSFGIVLLLSMLFFTFQSLLRPAISTLMSKRAGEDEQGYVAGLGNTYMSLGNIFGPIAAGLLYDVQPSSPYLFGSFVLLFGMGLFAIHEKRQSSQFEEKTRGHSV